MTPFGQDTRSSGARKSALKYGSHLLDATVGHHECPSRGSTQHRTRRYTSERRDGSLASVKARDGSGAEVRAYTQSSDGPGAVSEPELGDGSDGGSGVSVGQCDGRGDRRGLRKARC